MPKGKTRKFINKRDSVTFHLVHRSQKDPLIADETAPQRVLVPVGDTQAPKSEKKSLDIKKRKEEQQKYGIYFDDDYDYLQHLKDVNNLSTEWERVENPNVSKSEKKDDPKIKLPSSVFASTVEEKVGLLNKAAPVSGLQLDLDPDVIAAMDDDFDFDNPQNELEDNFIELANAGSSDDEFDENEEYEYELNESDEEHTDEKSNGGHMEASDEERDEICSLPGTQYNFDEEETKSRFTEYSMSSSVIRRNEQLTLLDDKFEKMYSVYDENEIGALDCDEIEGHIASNSDLLLQCVEDFCKEQKEDSDNITQLMKERLKLAEENDCSSEEDDLEKLIVEPREKEKWDCESILSTYSNIYNHPKLLPEPKGIRKIKIDPKTGIPKDVLGNATGKLTTKALAQFDLQNETTSVKGARSVAETMKSTLSMLSIRPKGESPDDKRARKKALKLYRKERRVEKKANSEAFKDEKKRQEKIMLNNRQNIQGNRIL